MTTDEKTTNEAPAQEKRSGEWTTPTSEPSHLAPQALADWRELTRTIFDIATKCGLTKTQVASRANMPLGTFSPWYDGTYQGNYPNQANKIRAFILAHEEAQAAARDALEEPEWVETPTVARVMTALTYAQQAPAIVLITLGPGMGKTTASRRFAATRPHAYRVVMRPSTGSVHSMLREVAEALEVNERDPAKLTKEIGRKIKRNGRHPLLMIDEAQNLKEQAVNELRYFMDEYGCGIALLGNEDVHSRFGGTTPKEGYGQLQRRIGMRIHQLKPKAEDIEAFVSAWGIEDADVVRLLKVIGGKPGSLGQVTETLKLASIHASGYGRPISAADVRLAWMNRGGEEVR